MNPTLKPYLIDVTRLVWRVWSGRLPTGIDRVCQEYLDRFGSQALAVIQRKGHLRVLSAKNSDRIFAMLAEGGPRFRFRFALFVLRIFFSKGNSADCSDRIYINVGHTGLDEPALGTWIHNWRIRAVLLVHDLIPITHPHFCRPGEAAKHDVRMRNALAFASGIIVNSRTTLDALRHYAESINTEVPPTLVAWLGGPAMVGSRAPNPLLQPYFVALGTIEGRKNHLLLLRVWQALAARLGDRTPLLVIVGQRGWEADEVFEILDSDATLKDYVQERSRCDDNALSTLICGARALLMPSFVEGFGLPVIESLQLGTPVIASDLGVYREIGGGIPLLIDANDSQAWEQAIVDYLDDDSDRIRQISALPGYRPPTWNDHFTKVEDWLKTLKYRRI